MSGISREEFELGLRILESLEGDIRKERFEELEKQIQTDPAAAQQYLDQVMNHAALMWRCQSLQSDKEIPESPEDTRFLNAMGEYEKTAPAVQTDLPQELSRPAVSAKPAVAARQVNKFSLVTAIASLAALVFLLIYIEMHPAGSEEPMAVIADSLHAVWGSGQAVGKEPEPQITRQTGPLDLKEGYVRITYACGTEVIVEGPARFEAAGPKEMSVSYGQLYARSPFSAVGFTVSSPRLKIIDLGTEFGVKVAGDGSADVHMIKGKASLAAGQKGTVRFSEMIHEGTARRVDSQEGIREIRLQEDLFARQISSSAGLIWRGENLDLADVVGGGSGLGSGRAGRGIRLSTGKPISADQDGIRDGRQGGYAAVSENNIIDGVFVPGRSSEGAPVVSSAGHRFRICPETTGTGLSGIYNGRVLRASGREYFSMVLQEEGSAASWKPAICLYGNAGVTFDLEAVRDAVPQCTIKAFRAVCGLSPYAANHPLPTGSTLADIFVLVDGTVSYESRAVSRFSQPREIRIPIDPADRFVTLIGTDGGQGLGMDWIVFAEPCLELTLED